jgi:hypothetical protein
VGAAPGCYAGRIVERPDDPEVEVVRRVVLVGDAREFVEADVRNLTTLEEKLDRSVLQRRALGIDEVEREGLAGLLERREVECEGAGRTPALVIGAVARATARARRVSRSAAASSAVSFR